MGQPIARSNSNNRRSGRKWQPQLVMRGKGGKFRPSFSLAVSSTAVWLLWRPVGRLVVTVGGELVSLGAVGQHGPDLTRSSAGGFEDEVATVGGPPGALVAPFIAGELDNLLRSRFHDVDIVVAAGTAPAKGQQLAVWRPGGIDEIAL